jgi:hypothetical protein
MKACIAAALCLISGASAGESLASPQVLAAPVLVELFTSEGCSSCPPADDALRSMARSQPVQGARIIALGFHVDYWDQLGWRDAYSSSAFTARQMAYGEAFQLQGVYTPQLVVDGSRQLIGGSSGAKEEIALAARRAKATVLLSAHATGDGSVELQVTASRLPPVSAGDQVELWLAISEDDLRSNVLRGENSGRKLPHAAVVRRLELFGRLAKGEREISARRTQRLDPSWKPEQLSAVAFLQEKKSRRVLGLAAVSLAAAR